MNKLNIFVLLEIHFWIGHNFVLKLPSRVINPFNNNCFLDDDESPIFGKKLVDEDLTDPEVEKIELELQRLQRIKKLKEEVLELQKSLKVSLRYIIL